MNGNVEWTLGAQSGEIFVRANGGQLSTTGATLCGARPFLEALLGLDSPRDEHGIQQWTIKTRRMELQREARWLHSTIDLIADHTERDQVALGSTDDDSPCESYASNLARLEQILNQHAAAIALRVYALLDAKSDYISDWAAKEESECTSLRRQTKLLFRFNLFSLQLEHETSGRACMRRLAVTDPQRRRCAKAAAENIRRGLAAAVEVLEVFKIENRLLLDVFQQHTVALPPGIAAKIKGLFCSVPAASIEHCIAFGMHSIGKEGTDDDREPCFWDRDGNAVRIFSRTAASRATGDSAPGTQPVQRARARAIESPAVTFPRMFSRYSTLQGDWEATDTSGDSGVRYLMLCRVAMGKTQRVESVSEPASWPDDPLVGTLLFDDEEYLVRYPQAVVPEFLLQCRIVPAAASDSPTSRETPIVPVTLSDPTALVASVVDLDALDCDVGVPMVSAFPLHLEGDPRDCVFTDVAAAARRSSLPLSNKSLPLDVVLANCVRQQAQLLEALDELHRRFWRRARELWQESARPVENVHGDRRSTAGGDRQRRVSGGSSDQRQR